MSGAAKQYDTHAKRDFRGKPAGYVVNGNDIEAELPSIGHSFQISCFPNKIKGASAGWTRAVAVFDE